SFAASDADSYHAVVKEKGAVSWPLQEMSYGTRELGIRECNGYSLAFQTAVVREIDNIRGPRMRISLPERESASLIKASFVDVDLAGASIEASNLTREGRAAPSKASAGRPSARRVMPHRSRCLKRPLLSKVESSRRSVARVGRGGKNLAP